MRKFRLVLISAAILVLLGAADTFATGQTPDKIIFNGKEYMLHSNPFEWYFVKFPEKKPKSENISSSLARGYVATFEIIDDALFLKDIQIQIQKKDSKNLQTEWKSILPEIVPDGGKLKIDWYTGLLVMPHGKMVQLLNAGYASTYENYILLEIAAGDVTRIKEFDHQNFLNFRELQFHAFKQTEQYRILFSELRKNENTTADFIDDFLKGQITTYSTKILVD